MQRLWIGRSDATLRNWKAEVLPAPMFRREFTLTAEVKTACLKICGLGYYELHLNGARVGDHVLDPIVTKYDRLARYVSYDVANGLQAGENAVGVMLGNGWYNCFTADAWHFDKASWRDYPKLWMELTIELVNGQFVSLRSDKNWKIGESPIRFDGLRNGETYDAREEQPGWDLPGFDDSDWAPAGIVPGPGGILEEQTSPPCKVMDTLTPKSIQKIRSGVFVYDIGQNIAGWAQLRVWDGDPGTEIVLRYGEKLKDNGEVEQSNINSFIRSGECQTDRYIMKGTGEEVWEPRFTYHGFRYVQVEGLPAAATLNHLRARVVRTAFDKIGTFNCSNEDVNSLQRVTEWSYIGNFVGIPTDCPHREKNGWTGDAQLAAETGLMNYDVAGSYTQWLDTMACCQRPNGQFPGIVPSSGWGYNWGSGPAWDAAFLLIPWYIYLYTGNSCVIERHYDAARRYLDFCNSMATDHILSFGLGDWCPVEPERMPPAPLTSTAYYYVFAKTLSAFARITGNKEDFSGYEHLASSVRAAFNREFYRGNGVYDRGQMTALGCALYQGLVEETEREAVAQKLLHEVEVRGCKVDFGILGAKYVPRALADHGFVDVAYRLITQPEFPGWMHWLLNGATTFRESWGDTNSRNHIMFGDISAWFYNYLGGINPDPDRPGFEHVLLKPCPIAEVDRVHATHRSPFGLIDVRWEKQGDGILYSIDTPPGTVATFAPHGKSPQQLAPGHHEIHHSG